MKTKCLLPVILFVTLINFTTSVHAQHMKDRLYIGVFNSLYDPLFSDNYGGGDPHFFPMYKQLSFNLGHAYSFHWDYDLYHWDGGFYDSISSYIGRISQLHSAWNTNYPGLNSLLLERNKIGRAAFGQRSTYQAETNPYTVKPGYGYDSARGTVITDEWQGETVICRYTGLPSSPAMPYYLLKKLHENREQVNVWWTGETGDPHDAAYNLSDVKKYPYYWYVKPRMRVDSVFAKNPVNRFKPVVAVITKNFNGETVDSTVIVCDNFLQYVGQEVFYNGRYLELYYNLPSGKLQIEARQLTAGTDPRDITLSKVDYQIYWFGEVAVYLDYVRVDDEWAHFLFNPQLEDPFNPKYNFTWKINQEVSQISTMQGFGYFYIDENYYNNFPCIKKVDSLIKAGNPNTGLVIIANDNYISSPTYKNPPTWQDGYEYLYTTGAVKDMLFTDVYPWGDVNQQYQAGILPPNVTLPDTNVFPGTRRYYKAGNNSEYNDVTMNNMENGLVINPYWHTTSMMDVYRQCARFIKDHPAIVFNLGTQIHTVEGGDSGPREPTNEEISMQCFLGLTYGAKIITYYVFYTLKNATPYDPTKFYYNWGMLNTNNYDPRDTNYYGQPKYNFLMHIDSVLKRLGNIMYPQGVQNHFVWDGASCVNTYPVNENHTNYNPLPYKYIDYLVSYFRDPVTGGFVEINADPIAKRYWEIGFFNKPNDPSSKYFILLNKRLTPEDEYKSGDRREVKLHFNRNEPALANFVNYKLTDMLTGESVIFNIDDPLGIRLPMEFWPGEGKLFKLSPVMKVGGGLVADEIVPGTEDFVCEDTVFSGGYSITIEDGAKIHFTDTSTIVMSDSGTFTMGDPMHQGPLTTTADAVSGNHWYGFNFSNCVA